MRKSQHSLSIHGENAADKTELALAFNRFFCSFFTQDNGSEPNFIPITDVPPTSDISVSEQGMLSLWLNLDPKKRLGVDSIPNTFLVRYAEWCSKYLCLIVKKSLSEA